MRLYDLTEQYKDLLELAEMGDPIPAEFLDGLESKIEEKAENIAAVMKSLEHEEAALKVEAERLAHRAAGVKKNREGLKRYLEEKLAEAKLDKIKGRLFSLTLAKKAPSVLIVDEKSIPGTWWKPANPTLDRAGMLEALKAGTEIPGARLYNDGHSLRIR